MSEEQLKALLKKVEETQESLNAAAAAIVRAQEALARYIESL